MYVKRGSGFPAWFYKCCFYGCLFTLLVCRCCFLSDCDGFSMNAAQRHVTGFHSHVTSAPPCCRKSSAAPRSPSDYGLIRAGGRRGRGAESLRLGKILASFLTRNSHDFTRFCGGFCPRFKRQKMKSSVCIFARLRICQDVKILAG